MVDITDAEFVEIEKKSFDDVIILKRLDEDDSKTIFNVIIMENDKDSMNE